MTLSQQSPKTPPQRTRQPETMITPRTPRYAPIDEPDTHTISPTLNRNSHKKKTITHDKTSKLAKSPSSSMSLLTLPSRPILTKPVLPMTPDQTPVIRKQIPSVSTSAKSSSTVSLSASRELTEDTIKKTLKSTILFTTPSASTSSLASASTLSTSEKATTKPVVDLKKKLVSPKLNPTKKRKLQVFHDSAPPIPPVFKPTQSLKRPHHSTVLDGDDDLDTSKPIASSSSLCFSSSTKEREHPYDSPITCDVPGMWHIFRGKKIFRPFATGSDPFKNYVPRVLFKSRKDSTVDTTTTSTGSDLSLEGMSTPILQKPYNKKRITSQDLSLTPTRQNKKQDISIDGWSDSDEEQKEIAAIIESAKKRKKTSDPSVRVPIHPQSTETDTNTRSVREIEDEEAETEHETEIPSAIQTRTISYRNMLGGKALFTPTKPRKQPGNKKQFFR